MGTEVFPISLSVDRCYVIRDEGAIMVDGGLPRQEKAFLSKLSKTPVRPEEIRLIVLTHGHFDHAGSAQAISDMTGASIAAHRLDVDVAEGRVAGLPTPQTPWARAMMGILGPVIRGKIGRTSARVDVVVGDQGLSLSEYGVRGRILHTPGHTAGSLSVLLDNGDAFVGCMSHSGPPFRLKPDLPIFADYPDQLRQSWDMLLRLGARRIYPGHGDPFPAEAISRSLRSGSWGKTTRTQNAGTRIIAR
ncbi:MAG: MBL fold metallo-hydrolase [Chloroflexota bacterium]|nr:MBL fold metallo-hydrolase [Chloroflexota bacterium]